MKIPFQLVFSLILAASPLCCGQEKGSPSVETIPISELRVQAEKGDAHAQWLLSNKYLTGNGIDKDLVEGRKWSAKANAQDYTGSHLSRGALMYALGMGENNIEKIKEAAKWYQKAVDQGSIIGQALIAGTYIFTESDRTNDVALKCQMKALNQLTKGPDLDKLNQELEWIKELELLIKSCNMDTKTVLGFAQPIQEQMQVMVGKSMPVDNAKASGDVFGDKVIKGTNREGPVIKGFQIGMHITEARQEANERFSNEFKAKYIVVKAGDVYKLRDANSKPLNADDGIALIKAGMGGDEILVVADKNGIVFGFEFSAVVVGMIFNDVANLPMLDFARSFANSYKLPNMKYSMEVTPRLYDQMLGESQEEALKKTIIRGLVESKGAAPEDMWSCITSDGVNVRIYSTKAITVEKKNIRGSKGFD